MATDVAGMVAGSSRDCWDEGTIGSSAEGVAGSLISTSMGIVKHTSKDCCDDGMTSSSREEGVVVEVPVSSSTEVAGSCCNEGVVSSYPNPPRDRIMSGAPSIDSRRGQVVMVTPWDL